eukprot:TRINITY_DN3860_c0_g1_i1.p1 TRINITY_DN3860_c0_g1~~TRINITY_DN3860_c0_g1_i1.p1  ORF type:complete len:311 (-),score=114.71 TRINITY_DN3860_c0_g1_i1:941-1873(-)
MKDFIVELCKHAFDSQYALFKTTEAGDLYPNPASALVVDQHLRMFDFLGAIMGKAMYEGILVDIPFAKFFLSKLLNKFNDPNELQSLDKDVHKSMQFLKNYKGDVLDLGLTFTVLDQGAYEFGHVDERELLPGGRDIDVTQENKHKFVYLMCNYLLHEQIKEQTAAFVHGFLSVIPARLIRMFSQDELQRLISGDNVPIDVEDMRNHVQYANGYSRSDTVIEMFWDVVQDMSAEERQALLKFITSVPRPPLLGFKDMHPPICVTKSNEEHRLPSAATCFNKLTLPPYADYDTMKKMLLLAISEGTTFELS